MDKKLAAEIRSELKVEIEALAKRKIVPGLAVVIVGDDPASHVYVRNKHKACQELGITSFVHALPANTTERKVLNLVKRLNEDKAVHGILVQSPPPNILKKARL